MMMRCGIAAVLMACASLVSAAEVTLKLKYPPNTTRTVQIEQKSEQVLTIGPQDVETKSSTFIVQKQTIGPKLANGSVEIVEKIDVLQNELNLPGGLTFQFDSANPDKAASNPLLEPIAKLLRISLKTPATVVIDAEGKLQAVKIPEAAINEVDEDFRSMLDPEKRTKAAKKALEFLPSKPVKSGDSWEQTVDADLGGGQTLTITNTLTYQGVVDVDGKKLHKITHKPKDVSYFMDPNAKSPLKVTNSELKPTEGGGELLFDEQAGDIVLRQSSMRIQGKLTLDFGGQQLPGKLDLKLSDKIARQP